MSAAGEQQRRKQELRALIRSRFGTTRRAATALSQITGDAIAEQTLHRWKSNLDNRSARRCPGWVALLLKQAGGKRHD